jgi:hypothetical protein
VAADVATAALPDASAARAGASVMRAASLVDRLAAGTSAPAPGTCPSAASAALGEGAQAPTSQGGLPLSLSSSSPPPTMSTPRSPEGRVPAAHATDILRPSVPGAPAAGSFAPSCALLTPAPVAAPHARARARGVGGSDRAVFTATLCWEERSARVTAARRGGMKEKGEAYSPAGRRGA